MANHSIARAFHRSGLALAVVLAAAVSAPDHHVGQSAHATVQQVSPAKQLHETGAFDGDIRHRYP